jgi:phospholipid/cholesterol/gamma-HCH transport system substrate-binding protein
MASRLEFKVGLFVVLGLALLATLMIQFSKGASWFRSSYAIYLEAQDVGGLRERAAVLMSGVQIGAVQKIELSPDGRSVTATLKIDERFKVYTNATFTLEQAGFLGDQYVSVQQRERGTVVYKDGGHAVAEKPFNIQEAARSAQGLIKRVDDMARGLGETIADMRRFLLNQDTMTNVSAAALNLRLVSEHALASVQRFEEMIATNTPSVQHSTSNLAVFSDELAAAGAGVNMFVSSNRSEIGEAVQNVKASTEVLKQVMEDVRAGKGLAGALVKDERIANDLARIANNLSVTTSNLNQLGLWGILWKKKVPDVDTAALPNEILRSPKASNK